MKWSDPVKKEYNKRQRSFEIEKMKDAFNQKGQILGYRQSKHALVYLVINSFKWISRRFLNKGKSPECVQHYELQSRLIQEK